MSFTMWDDSPRHSSAVANSTSARQVGIKSLECSGLSSVTRMLRDVLSVYPTAIELHGPSSNSW